MRVSFLMIKTQLGEWGAIQFILPAAFLDEIYRWELPNFAPEYPHGGQCHPGKAVQEAAA